MSTPTIPSTEGDVATYGLCMSKPYTVGPTQINNPREFRGDLDVIEGVGIWANPLIIGISES